MGHPICSRLELLSEMTPALPVRATLIGDITAQASRAADSTGVEDSEMGLYVKKVTHKFEQAGPHGSAPSRPVDVVIHEYGGTPGAAGAAAQLQPVPR